MEGCRDESWPWMGRPSGAIGGGKGTVVESEKKRGPFKSFNKNSAPEGKEKKGFA